jgi:hypothetical protein
MKIGSYEIGLGHSFYPSMWGLMIVKEDEFSFIPLGLLVGVGFLIVIGISMVLTVLG